MTSSEEMRNLPLPQPRRPREREHTGGAATTQADRLLARIRELGYLADRVMDDHVVGPHGQNLTVAEAHARAGLLDGLIELEQVRGSLRHRRVNRLTRVLTLLTVTVVDLPIMLWLASSVFNVDWTAPLGLPLLISVVISVLATVGAATALHHLGHNQRQHKNHRRQLEWGKLSTGAKLSLLTVGLLVGLMGVVMFVRVSTEGLLSGMDGLALLMAVLVALVMVVCRRRWCSGRPSATAHWSRTTCATTASVSGRIWPPSASTKTRPTNSGASTTCCAAAPNGRTPPPEAVNGTLRDFKSLNVPFTDFQPSSLSSCSTAASSASEPCTFGPVNHFRAESTHHSPAPPSTTRNAIGV
jgi:hypothetical protein